MIRLVLSLLPCIPLPPSSLDDDERVDVRAVLKEFEEAFASEEAAARVSALEALQSAQARLPKPDKRLSKAIGEAFEDEAFDVKIAAARQLRLAHDPGEAIDQYERAMKIAAKDLAGVPFDDPLHDKCQTWLKTLFESLGAYRDDRALRQLMKFMTEHRYILHGDALQSIAQSLLDYECTVAVETVLDYQVEAEKSRFSGLLRNRIKDSLRAMAEAREIDAPPERAEDGSYAETLRHWMKRHGRHFDKSLGRLKSPRTAS